MSAMIARIKGEVIGKGLNFLTIDTGGVAYRIFCPPDALAQYSLAEEATLFTHLAVRENAHDLYGFGSEVERAFFELLISVSGIGPKSALSILSLAPVETIRNAVAHGDTSYLTKVSGIGKKNAEKIVLELGDKLGALEEGGTTRHEDVDVLDALKELGYSTNEARDALKHIPPDVVSTEARLKEALKQLGTPQ
ncbi:Holliday junction branch migration protein RuvA [Candidatus Kaiserbacteria bacterium CG10_big_fil_rev_8_21_14_0_10_49_17]|uniref:Holliday junction branch migration complex subunit RuvA n=1 Tax=Candidatus Kaiserbacteria bacterium CG10_big_fil_rev_8_21_14_0_10_49_17 TaxID=1974609 RepID=A0A2M6WDF8_9BACT|nr:MAG: Holliday junction branch migration protein RuvA [Candidatus Kaiserbacteria bacterium CG10_big_fil_rev_8_21_14_0_10_49_17]